ncbi:54S ribosomal protein L39, mitochondrial [Tyrophagus putrescentiae]|nr:54S ribosomal protein L39, mitochondrial [Tyrophagus putrescentiae]
MGVDSAVNSPDLPLMQAKVFNSQQNRNLLSAINESPKPTDIALSGAQEEGAWRRRGRHGLAEAACGSGSNACANGTEALLPIRTSSERRRVLRLAQVVRPGAPEGRRQTVGRVSSAALMGWSARRIASSTKNRSGKGALVSRIEKIEVILEKPFPTHDDVVLMMNRSISTPYDCAAHISELLRNRSALAVVDGTESWHMHQPLENSCHLRLLHFKHDDPMPVNYAFWRSCSMLLASVVKRAFKEEHPVAILSPPMSDLAGGSFVVDASIASLPDTWTPTTEELRSFTSLLWDEVTANRHFERLQVSADTARKLFAGDAKRLAQIGEASSSSDTTTFTVYRVGDHIELCEEALIASTGLIGSIFTSAVHRISTPNGGTFYRFQGVALPRQLHINAYAFSLIRDRAKQLNSIGLS